MKLTYNAVAASLLSVLSFSAMADIEIYGKANVALKSSDAGDGSFTELSSNASRLGFKGTQALDNGLEVLFKAEFELDLDSDKEKTFKNRNQYVGLKGNFGTVLLGTNDTMLKQSQGKVDLFGDSNADIKHLWEGENREGNSVTYISPSFSGVKVGVTYIAEDDVDADAGISASVMYGDAKLKKSNVFASVAIDSEVDGYDVVRVTAQTKLAGVTFGGIYQTQEAVDGTGELDGLMFSAKYNVNGFDLKTQVQTANDDDADTSKLAYTFGTDYKLAKSTKVFAAYTAVDNDEDGEDESYLAVGLEYKF